MYCMKALGVVHFKGNWTNIEKKKKTQKTQHTAFIVPFHFWNTPPKVISDEQSRLKQVWTFEVCACVYKCVRVCVCGFHCG